jgi:hypothetical protein
MPRVSFSNHVGGLEQGGIAFFAMVEDEDVLCVVTLDALQEYFGAIDMDGASMMGAFQAKEGRIRSAAKSKINEGAFEPDGSVLLRSVDFWI